MVWRLLSYFLPFIMQFAWYLRFQTFWSISFFSLTSFLFRHGEWHKELVLSLAAISNFSMSPFKPGSHDETRGDWCIGVSAVISFFSFSYPSSRMLVVSFHPVSTLRQAIPIIWASKFYFSSKRFVYPYLFRRLLLDMVHWRGLGNEIVLFWLDHFRSITCSRIG